MAYVVTSPSPTFLSGDCTEPSAPFGATSSTSSPASSRLLLMLLQVLFPRHLLSLQLLLLVLVLLLVHLPVLILPLPPLMLLPLLLLVLHHNHSCPFHFTCWSQCYPGAPTSTSPTSAFSPATPNAPSVTSHSLDTSLVGPNATSSAPLIATSPAITIQSVAPNGKKCRSYLL